jgi:hypothetical protein
MAEGAPDPVRRIIQLDRRPCASEWLEQQHTACKDAIEILVAPGEVKKRLRLDQLHMWTLCSREAKSSVMHRNRAAHVIVDGFQLLALSRIISSVALSKSWEAATSTLLALLAEALLRAGRLELAYRCKTSSLEIAERSRRAFTVTRSAASMYYLHYIQRLFVLGHELGHAILGGSEATEGRQIREDLDLRIEEIRRRLQEQAPRGLRKQVESSVWTIRDERNAYRDELCCDSLSVELVENATARLGGRDRSAICEAIVACVIGLDILRLFKRLGGDEAGFKEDGLIEALFDQNFIRTVHVGQLLSHRFGVSSHEMARFMERLGRAFSSNKGGLLHAFSLVDKMRQLSARGGRGIPANLTTSQVEAMCSWVDAPNAVLHDRIY